MKRYICKSVIIIICELSLFILTAITDTIPLGNTSTEEITGNYASINTLFWTKDHPWVIIMIALFFVIIVFIIVYKILF